MRKAVWGTIVLGIWALSFGSPIREIGWLHQVLGLGLIVGYLLVSLDPPEQSRRQRDLFIAGIACSIGAFVLAFLPLPPTANVFARVLAVAVVALPLWLVAGPIRSGFIAAAVLAAATAIPALADAGGYATSLHAYVTALSAFAVAVLMHKPTLLVMGERKPPRIVVASNIVTYTPEEKQRMLDRLEKRYRAGEMPEHVYLDKRQEIESH